MKFKDIPQMTYGNYRVNVPWRHLKNKIEEDGKDFNIDFDPDFQRAHVWNKEQQIAYCEWILKGGKSGRELLFNCQGWRNGSPNNYVLVDGKQRLTAVLAFLNNENPVFGNNYFKDFRDKLGLLGPDFIWVVNDLETHAEVLQWYLDFNSGGVVHSEEEINKVKKLLENVK